MQHCMCASAYHDMHHIVYILCVHTNTIYTICAEIFVGPNFCIISFATLAQNIPWDIGKWTTEPRKLQKFSPVKI